MSAKHLFEQMWINVHLFFKPEIKPDLPPNRFLFCSILFQRDRNEEMTEIKLKEKQRSIAIV